MKTALYFAPALVITIFFLIRAEILGKKNQIYILKPLSTLLIIVAALVSFQEPTLNMTYSIGILTGLVFSLGGDIALMFQEHQKSFLIGLTLFLVGHLFYTATFFILGRFTIWDILSTTLLLTAALWFYKMIEPNLGSMRIPVIAYILIITLMVSRALSTLVSPVIHLQQALMIVFGALLFYISDLILAANRFWRPWKYHRISLVFYFGGQFLLALAASYFGG